MRLRLGIAFCLEAALIIFWEKKKGPKIRSDWSLPWPSFAPLTKRHGRMDTPVNERNTLLSMHLLD